MFFGYALLTKGLNNNYVLGVLGKTLSMSFLQATKNKQFFHTLQKANSGFHSQSINNLRTAAKLTEESKR